MISDTPITRYAKLLLIIVAAFVVHGYVLDRFWLNDDPQVLLHALRYEPIEIVTEKSSWQELSGSNFTPLVTWSFDADLTLFGPRPRAFYVHQILAIAIAAIALRLLMLQLGVDKKSSLIVALLFLITPPTIRVAGSLMTRHYIEGLIAATLSVILWVASDRKENGSRFADAGSAMAYFIALMAKEVFILLPLILIALDLRRPRWKRLIIRSVPLALAFLGYMSWRFWILDGGGGYGEKELLEHLGSVATIWIADNAVTAIWFSILIVIGVALWVRSSMMAARFCLCGLAAVLPLAGIGDALEPRHLLVPAVVALTGAIGAISLRTSGRLRAALLSIVVLIGIGAAIESMRFTVGAAQKMEAEGRYVWDEDRDALPLFGNSPGWYLGGIADLDRILRNESSPEVVYSETGLLLRDSGARYISFSDEGRPRLKSLADISMRDRYRPDDPLELEIRREGRALHWTFGPDCDCEWRFYSYPEYQMFVVPRKGSRVVPLPLERQWFRIERRNSNGEWTMSPPLALPSDGNTTRWERTRRQEMRNH